MHIWKIYLQCISKASTSLLRSPAVIVGTLALGLIFSILAPLLGFLGIVGSFIFGILTVLMLSTFYGWIRDLTSGEKIKFTDLLKLERDIFFAVIDVGFILWLVNFIPRQLLMGINSNQLDSGPIFMSMGIFIAIAFNPVPEVIMSHGLQGISALSYAFQFSKQRFFEWFIPFCICILPTIVASKEAAIMRIAQMNPIFPASSFAASWGDRLDAVGVSGILLTLALGLFICWIMLFRLFLFQALDGRVARPRKAV